MKLEEFQANDKNGKNDISSFILNLQFNWSTDAD